VPSCCATASACVETDACDMGGGGGPDSGAPASDPCTCCATKAPAPEQDPVDPILSAHPAGQALLPALLGSCAISAPVLACTGLPDDGCGAPWANGPWPCAHAAERCAQLSSWTE
jgi:hypothetical protein